MLHRHKKINKKELRFYRWGKPELAWNPLSTEEVKKKKEKKKARRIFLRQLACDMNILKRKTRACDFSLHPLSLARWASSYLYLCLLISAELIRLKVSTWENFKLFCIQKKKKRISPKPLFSLYPWYSDLYETLVSFGVENTLIQAWRSITSS